MDAEELAYRLGMGLRKAKDNVDLTIRSMMTLPEDRSVDGHLDGNASHGSDDDVFHDVFHRASSDSVPTSARIGFLGSVGSSSESAPRYMIMTSFPDGSRIRWRVRWDQDPDDALVVSAETFAVRARDLIASGHRSVFSHDAVDPEVFVVQSGQMETSVITMSTINVVRSGTVVAVCDLVELPDLATDDDGSAGTDMTDFNTTDSEVPYVPYNPYDSRWPWPRTDSSKYRYAARSMRP